MPIWFFGLGAAFADTLEVGPDAAFREIFDAIDEAANGDRIEVQPGEYVGPVLLGNKDLEIVSTGGSAVTTLIPVQYGDYFQPVVVVEGSHPITLRGFTLDGGGHAYGLIVGYGGDLFAEDLVLFGGPARNLAVDNGTLTLVDSAFSGAVGAGGAHAEIYQSNVEFERVVFTKGSSDEGGGAIFAFRSQAVFRECTFADNQGAEGGALFVDAGYSDSVTTIEDSLFERNEALFGSGGAVVQYGGILTMTRTTVRDNVAQAGTGGIDHSFGSQFRFEDGRVEGNHGAFGGGIAVNDQADTAILGSTFEGNTTDDDGGGLMIVGTSVSAEISGNRFCGNEAVGDLGGAVWLDTYLSLTADLHNNVFLANSAGNSGAAVSISGSVADLAQNTIVGSSSGVDGGAVWVGRDGSATLVNNAIVDSVGAAAAKATDAAELHADYTLVFDNDRDLVGIATSPTTVEADPGFRAYVPGDCGSDLHPGSGSALVDAGDPSRLDDDGSRSDIGAYGGPGGSTLVGEGCTPTADEVPGDGLDQDCDGLDLCYVDADGDGAGGDVTAAAGIGCAGSGFAPASDDCDDADPSRTVDCAGSAGGSKGPLPPLWFCATTGGKPSWPMLAWVGAWLALRRVGRRDASPVPAAPGKPTTAAESVTRAPAVSSEDPPGRRARSRLSGSSPPR